MEAKQTAYFPLFVGLRYFRRASGKDKFMSLISWFSLLGVLLGVLSLIVVMSVMNGFEAELQQRVLSVVPHARVEGPQQRLTNWQSLSSEISARAGVSGVAPYVGDKAMLSAGSRISGVALYGIDPELERQVSGLAEHMLAGQYLSEQDGEYPIILGDILARSLGVRLGQKLRVILPKVTVTPFGMFPREKEFVVAGVFSAGAQLDASTAFIRLDDAQRLYQLGKDVQGLRLQFEDMFAAPFHTAEIVASLPEGSRGEDWSQSQGSLFHAVKMEKTLVRILLLFIIVIAAFNIISILSMAVSEKRGAIAVLRTMGATPASIMKIFVIYGMSTGVLGVVLGVLIGLPLALHVGDVVAWLEGVSGLYLFDPQVYFISHLPSKIVPWDVAFVALFSLSLCFLATLYPAWRGSQVQPAEALRYE
ncbi:lipoprotein-releasing ABC transporter permease subunit [Spongiibacter sp. KMU-158]|uniref:Lipoprotein-releasing ABC transporter permease subunit n=1 Tax=Spongiibacter pelagi TaxID=2760804 RepID=A0A927GVV6_9GAMM|nr:lipoprotein-releasing ABC transporter permease subunit [Spongiibacter pelagi]